MEVDFPIILFENSDDWEAWLETHHNNTEGIWLRFAKKSAPFKTVSYYDAVTAALCYGWIDGIVKKYDTNTFIQRFTPRKPRSQWSLINKERALKLIEDGLMKPSGLAAIEHSKKNGNWDKAYEPQSTILIPDDFLAGLNKNPDAAKFFQKLDSRNRYAFIHRLQAIKSEQKRAERIEIYIEMLNNKKKIYS